MAKIKNSLVSGVQDSLQNGLQQTGSYLKNVASDVLSLPRTNSGLRGVSKNTQAQVDRYSADYTQSDAVNQAQAERTAANDAVKNYGAYQSKYQDMKDDYLNQALNREKFSYDLNGDALYQQYKDQYMNQGAIAMADTIGQASAMTGGYGNSYAASVGNQAYQSYLSQLNDVVPQLYQLALDKYNSDTNDIYNKYNMVANADESEYSRWNDQYNRLVSDRDYYSNQYNNERNFDYGQYADNRSYWQNQASLENSDYWQNKEFNYGVAKDVANFAYGAYRDTVSDGWNALNFGYGAYRDSVADNQWKQSFDYQKTRDIVSDNQWQQTFDYNKSRDAVSDSQWQQTFDYNKLRDGVSDSQWEKEYLLKKASANSSSSSSGGSSKSSGSVSDTKDTTDVAKDKTYTVYTTTKGNTKTSTINSSGVAKKAAEYAKSYPNTYLNDATIDYWMANNGIGGEAGEYFKTILANEYGFKSRVRS